MWTWWNKLLGQLFVFFVLGMFAGLFGCKDDKKEECQVAAIYGPPPCTDNQDCLAQEGVGWYCNQGHTVDDGCGGQVAWPTCVRRAEPLDAGVPDAAVDSGCEPVAVYGPQPCASDAECQQREGSPDWYCDQTNRYDDGCGGSVSWPICVARTAPLDAGFPDARADSGCEPVAVYGPQPCASDAECRQREGSPDWRCDLDHTYDDGCGGQSRWPICVRQPGPLDAGVPDLTVDSGCEPMAVYGPRPCETDEQCQQWEGSPDWFCDVDHSFDNGCGGQIVWPVCLPRPESLDAGQPQEADLGCLPVAVYGPRPCQSDEECQQEQGSPDWFCDRANSFDNGCGGRIVWPVCRPRPEPLDAGQPQEADLGCMPVAVYGPRPCQSDEECQQEQGSPDWFCDRANSFDNGCGRRIVWPVCRQQPEPLDAGQPQEADLGCRPMAVYGPRPCQTDEECQEWMGGSGWYCDRENSFDNGCGQQVVWPVCRLPGER